MIFKRHLHFSVAEVLALRVYYDHVSEEHIRLRMFLKKIPDGPQSARQILFVAVQVSQNVAAGPAQAPIDSVIHALVFFNESSDALVLEQPIERPIVRARILDNVFDLDLLVGYRGNTEL